MKTGIIGLGAMGLPMAKNLLKGEHLAMVWNRTREKASDFCKATGVALADDPADLARTCPLVLTMVSRDADLLAVVNALLPGITPDSILVDLSTVAAGTARSVGKMIAARGGRFLDCPVSGGVEGAVKGNLAMMAGGDAATLDEVLPVLRSLGSHVVLVGAIGSGQGCKAVNQIIGAGVNQAVTEALAFGEAIGLDMEKVVSVVSRGASANWFLDHRGKSMLAEEFSSGFKVKLHEKDLQICRLMAKEQLQSALPIVEMTLVHYQRLIEQGYGDEDVSALFRLKKNALEKNALEQ